MRRDCWPLGRFSWRPLSLHKLLSPALLGQPPDTNSHMDPTQLTTRDRTTNHCNGERDARMPIYRQSQPMVFWVDSISGSQRGSTIGVALYFSETA